MTFDTAMTVLGVLEYHSTLTGEWHSLRQKWPIWLRVKDQPQQIYMDNGGELGDADFVVVELREDGYIWIIPVVGDPYKSANKWRLRGTDAKESQSRTLLGKNGGPDDGDPQ